MNTQHSPTEKKPIGFFWFCMKLFFLCWWEGAIFTIQVAYAACFIYLTVYFFHGMVIFVRDTILPQVEAGGFDRSLRVDPQLDFFARLYRHSLHRGKNWRDGRDRTEIEKRGTKVS